MLLEQVYDLRGKGLSLVHLAKGQLDVERLYLREALAKTFQHKGFSTLHVHPDKIWWSETYPDWMRVSALADRTSTGVCT